MIETLKSEIIKLLRDAGELVSEEDEFSFTRLGEGRGFSSLLWSVTFGSHTYAVKVTDTVSRVEEISQMVSLEDERKADFAKLFAEQHNRELQVYEWFKNRSISGIPNFYAGTDCDGKKPGIIIIESFPSECALKDGEGLKLGTVLDIVDTICSYQAAYLFPGTEKMELLSKDLFFEMASPTYKNCVQKVAEKGWMREEWKSALHSWCEIPELKKIQNGREEGDPPLTLAHCDLWANNLIFGRKSNGQLYLQAIIDWQCASVGNALLDVSSLVGINMNAEERRQHENRILEDYVETVTEKCSFTHYENPFPINLEQAEKLYKRGLKFAAIQLALALGTHCDSETKEKTLTARLKAILEDVVDNM